MRDFAWVLGVMRLLGIYFVFSSLPTIGQWTVSLIYAIRSPVMNAPVPWGYYLPLIVGNMVVTGFGMYLLLGGRALLKWVTRDLHNCCIHCGYTFNGLTGKTCPECGTERPVESSAQTPPPPAAERSN